jgi:hypothetical protein
MDMVASLFLRMCAWCPLRVTKQLPGHAARINDRSRLQHARGARCKRTLRSGTWFARIADRTPESRGENRARHSDLRARWTRIGAVARNRHGAGARLSPGGQAQDIPTPYPHPALR